jgi:hypothetical protein
MYNCLKCKKESHFVSMRKEGIICMECVYEEKQGEAKK